MDDGVGEAIDLASELSHPNVVPMRQAQRDAKAPEAVATEMA
jgi:hypothetical protein